MNILGVQWGKLLVNLNNAINALSGVSLADELRQRDFRRCWALCLAEGLQCTKAAEGGAAPWGAAALLRELTAARRGGKYLTKLLYSVISADMFGSKGQEGHAESGVCAQARCTEWGL